MLAVIGGGLYYFKVKSSLLKEAHQQCITTINNVNKDISLFLVQYKLASKVLSKLEEIKNCIKKPSQNNLSKANIILDIFASSFKIDVCYLMDKRGITIASSNRNTSQSFVGKDFSFRPYFKKAIKGSPCTYPALGTTSKKRGIYFSYPVYIDSKKEPYGVAVIKASVDYLESKFLSKFPGIFFFVTPDGIIFISNKKEWIFFTTHYLNNITIERIRRTKQMGTGPWLYSGFKFEKNKAVDATGRTYLVFERGVSFFPGWRLLYLLEEREILKKLHRPIVEIGGPFIILVMFLIGILVYVLSKVAQRELKNREEMEEKLRASEEKYRTIYHNTPAMLHSIDREYRLLRVSDYWLDITGYRRDEVIGKKLTSFFTPESRRLAEKYILPAFFKVGKAKNIHYQFIKKDGQIMDILLSCYGIKDKNGEVVETLAISIDVTERLKEQRELKEAKKKLSAYSKQLEKLVKQRSREIAAILKYTPSLVYLKNNQLQYRLINPGFESLFKISNEEVVGKKATEIFSDPIVCEFEKRDLEVLEKGKPSKIKEVLQLNGTTYTFLSIRFPIYSENGEVDGICGISTDITELEKTQRKLKELSKNIIENQEKERERISKELHDELGQILTVLNMDVSWLKKKIGSERPDLLKRISNMQELINKTIDEVRYLAFQLRPGSLDHLGLKEALESLISDFEKRTDIIYTYKKSEIPLLDNTTSTAIYRIVQEAITNAIRHASPKRINVGLFFKDGVVSLEISDDGIGFDVEEKKQNGLVFGILGMQERAELVGGRLHIFSKKGKGTTIIGRFPINKS